MVATARHILVAEKELCEKLKKMIVKGEDFAKVASKHSVCPSGKEGGDLGSFVPGEMVPEFDEVVFKEEVGTVHGPIKTDFGYHLIQIMSRS